MPGRCRPRPAEPPGPGRARTGAAGARRTPEFGVPTVTAARTDQRGLTGPAKRTQIRGTPRPTAGGLGGP